MTQQADPMQQAMAYMRHQAAKGLDSLAALIERTQADWERCLEGMTDAQARFAPVLSGAEGPAGEWSAREVLTHLLVASNGVNRQISQAMAGQPPEWPFRATGTANAEAESYAAMTLDELTRRLIQLFRETKSLVTSLDESGPLDATFQHPFFGELNIREWIAFQRLHAMDHIQQIDKIKADRAYPAP